MGQRAHTIVTQGQRCSLLQAQHPQQRFWPLLSSVRAEAVPATHQASVLSYAFPVGSWG